MKEISVINVHRATLLLQESTALFSEAEAAAKLESLVTHRLPLAEVQAAFEMASKYAEGVVKVMLQPSAPLRLRAARRVGILAKEADAWSSSPLLRGLAEDASVEVCFVAALSPARTDGGANGQTRYTIVYHTSYVYIYIYIYI